MKKKRFGGITRGWLMSIGGTEKHGAFHFTSTRDQFGHFEFMVLPNETGSATVRGWHFPERNGRGSDLKDQYVASRQKLLDLLGVMQVLTRKPKPIPKPVRRSKTTRPSGHHANPPQDEVPGFD